MLWWGLRGDPEWRRESEGSGARMRWLQETCPQESLSGTPGRCHLSATCTVAGGHHAFVGGSSVLRLLKEMWPFTPLRRKCKM